MVKRLIRHPWFWLALTLGLLVSLLAAFLRKLLAVRKKPGERVVVLFGDSITQGGMSHNYVDVLAERMQGEGYRFLNAGIGGDTAYNLLNRLEPVVASQPDAIAVLVGTNDIQAYLRGGHLSPLMQRMKKLPQAVTLSWYRALLRQIVVLLQKDTRASIALCAIPVLGEDLDSLPNQTVRLFNQEVRALADELEVAYLPIYESMEQFLCTHQQGPAQAFDETRAGALMLRAMWEHNIRGRRWEDVSIRNGLVLTTDTVHFNHRGAGIIADQIEGWLHPRAV